MALVIGPVGAAPLGKAQQTFNRLSARIAELRAELARWQAFDVVFHQRLGSEMQPLQARLREARKAMLLRLDDTLRDAARGAGRLGKLQRRTATRALLALAAVLLEEQADAEVEALHDRYSATSHQALRRAELAEAEAALGQMLGKDVLADHGAETVDDLARVALEKFNAAAQAEDARRQAQAERRAEKRRARGAAPTRAEAAAERREQAAQEATQSMREVYRKLASRLHPDREVDAAERARKAALMQQANDAYAAGDLLTLLTLQLADEQIDDAHLAGLSDTKLAHYNAVLREQQQALEDEIDAQTMPYRMAMGLPPQARLRGPEEVSRDLNRDLRRMKLDLADLESDLRAMQQPDTRAAVLREMARAFKERDADDEADAMLDALLQAHGGVAGPVGFGFPGFVATPSRRKPRR